MNEISEAVNRPKPLLSILIPVYNGEKYLQSLLGLFADAYLRMPASFADVEMIVANNVSEDATQTVAESFAGRLPMLRALALSPHLPTAEENIFRSFAYCTGEYTWALGVDDIPIFASFAEMMGILRDGASDFYLFNFALVSQKMHLQRSSVFFLKDQARSVSLVDLTQRFGFWFTVAGVSAQIMRTSLVRDYDLSALVAKTSKIYAHVVAYLECFRDSTLSVVNLPLVFYKVTHNDIDHWRGAAKKLEVFDEYFWTLGYVRQLEYLESQKIIGPDYLRYMLETNEFTHFRPVFEIAVKFGAQIKIMSATKDKRNHPTRAEFDELYEYLLRKEPFLREYLWQLKRLYLRLLEGKLVSETEWDELAGYKAFAHDYLLASLLQGIYGDYEIYRVAYFYYGVYRFSREILIERLRHLFDEELPPDVFVGESRAEVIKKISDFQRDQEGSRHITVDRSLIRMIQSSNADKAHVEQKLLAAHHELSMERQKFTLLKASTSWRITAPLRGLSRIAKKLVRR